MRKRVTFISRKGSIFFLSLWTLVFLSLLALFSGLMIRQQLLLLNKIEERDKLYDIAEAGIMTAIEVVNAPLGRKNDSNVDALNDFWFDDRDLFKDKTIEEGAFSVYYDYFDTSLNRFERRYGVIDESRNININYSSEDVLVGLFSTIAGLEKSRAIELACGVIDWRDANDLKWGHVEDLSEERDYTANGYGYIPKNNNFETIEELLFVRGMTTAIFAKIRDYITVFSDGRININTAPFQVLQAIGFSLSLAKKIAAMRSGENRIAGDFDDYIFRSFEQCFYDLNDYYELTDDENLLLQSLMFKNILSFSSNSFRAFSISKLENSKMYGKIICVFSKSGNIQYWSTQFSQEES